MLCDLCTDYANGGYFEVLRENGNLAVCDNCWMSVAKARWIPTDDAPPEKVSLEEIRAIL